MNNRSNSKGFTLVELMVVVVIIGIIASIGVPKLNGFIRTAETSEADTIAARIISGMEIKDNWVVNPAMIAHPRNADGTINATVETAGNGISHLINLEIPADHEWTYRVNIVAIDQGKVTSACVQAFKDDGTGTFTTNVADNNWIQRSMTAPDPATENVQSWDNNSYIQPYVNGINPEQAGGDCP